MTSPNISVVVAAWSGEKALARCLESLSHHSENAEIIVATNLAAGTVREIETHYPHAEFIFAASDATVFNLRALGADKARARLIALIEDHVTVSRSWMETLLAAHAGGTPVIGGPIANGLSQRAYDRALYLAEYGIYMPPVSCGPSEILSGVNVAYDRALLEQYREIWKDAFYETDVHAALRGAGYSLQLEPDALVRSHLEMTPRRAMIHLFQGGKHFGLFRRSQSAAVARAFWLLVSPAIPFLLLLRIMRQVARKEPTALPQLLVSLPFLLLLLGSWGAGEAAGYLEKAPTSDRSHNASYANRH